MALWLGIHRRVALALAALAWRGGSAGR